jgi:energy-coupling factor transporter transmembrane protein EcfT
MNVLGGIDMGMAIGVPGFLLMVAGIICAIVFGIILIVNVSKKKPAKTMTIATSISGGVFILGIILFSIGVANTPTDNHNASKNSSTAVATDATSSESDSSTSSSSSEPDILNETTLNFSDTSGQQTTKIDSARIEDVSSFGLTDDNGNDIKYALLIHMSVANKAPEEASVYPAQGHIVLSDGTQINGAEGLESDITDAFQGGDVANGATVKGFVTFPLSDSQANSFNSGNLKFEVLCGDENSTDKYYSVPIKFNN